MSAETDGLQKLRQRVEQLEELCGLREPVAAGVVKVRHRHRVATALQLLLKRELVTPAAFLLAVGSEADANMVKTYVHYTRRQLADWRIPLNTDGHRGWFVRQADKPRLKAALRGEPVSQCNVNTMGRKVA